MVQYAAPFNPDGALVSLRVENPGLGVGALWWVALLGSRVLEMGGV